MLSSLKGIHLGAGVNTHTTMLRTYMSLSTNGHIQRNKLELQHCDTKANYQTTESRIAKEICRRI
jgi:hypothetical protein